MATRIIEYGGQSAVGGFPVVPAEYFITKQAAMTATATSARSAAVASNTRLICVQSDEQIYCEVDNTATPTATADSYRIPAGGEQWFKVLAGVGAKVAIKT